MASSIPGPAPAKVLRSLLQLGMDCVQLDLDARPRIGPRPNLFLASSLEGTVVGRLIDTLRQLPCSEKASRVLGLLAHTSDLSRVCKLVNILAAMPDEAEQQWNPSSDRTWSPLMGKLTAQ